MMIKILPICFSFSSLTSVTAGRPSLVIIEDIASICESAVHMNAAIAPIQTIAPAHSGAYSVKTNGSILTDSVFDKV